MDLRPDCWDGGHCRCDGLRAARARLLAEGSASAPVDPMIEMRADAAGGVASTLPAAVPPAALRAYLQHGARHEAAHAVLADVLAVGLIQVSLDLSTAGRFLTRTRGIPLALTEAGADRAELARVVVAHIAVSLAGYALDTREDRGGMGSIDDLAAAEDLALWLVEPCRRHTLCAAVLRVGEGAMAVATPAIGRVATSLLSVGSLGPADVNAEVGEDRASIHEACAPLLGLAESAARSGVLAERRGG